MIANGPHLLGHPLRLGVSDVTARWITWRWSHHCPRRGGLPIEICEIDSLAWDESGTSLEIDSLEQCVEFRITPQGLDFRLGNAQLKMIWTESAIRIALTGDRDFFPPMLWAAVNEAIRHGGLIAFHASALAQDDRCVLLLAPSKTGKSTTLVTAALAGYRPVAEDWVWVDPRTRQVYGNDCEFRLWPDSFERFGDRLPKETEQTAAGKYRVPLDALPGFSWNASRLARVVLLRRDLTRASFWETPSQLEGVRALWTASGVPIHPDVRKQVQTGMQSLCADTPFAALSIGNTRLDFEPLLA